MHGNKLMHMCTCMCIYAIHVPSVPYVAIQAMEEGKSPVIIDNLNLQRWEMEPYAILVCHNLYQSVHNYMIAFWTKICLYTCMHIHNYTCLYGCTYN